MGEDAAPRAPYAGVGWGRPRVPSHLPQLLTTDHLLTRSRVSRLHHWHPRPRSGSGSRPDRPAGGGGEAGRTGLHVASQGSGSPRNKRGGRGEFTGLQPGGWASRVKRSAPGGGEGSPAQSRTETAWGWVVGTGVLGLCRLRQILALLQSPW